MSLTAWIVIAVLVTAALVLIVRRFRAENRKLDTMMREFDREHPVREPGSTSPARRLVGIRRRR
jgi:heme/copper-type cytochrome/quinol oxidase subunit 2